MGVPEATAFPSREDTSDQRCDCLAEIHATFDDPKLASRAGLVPVMALACRAGLAVLVEEHVQISRPCGVTAQVKVPGIVAGMTGGAEASGSYSVRSSTLMCV